QPGSVAGKSSSIHRRVRALPGGGLAHLDSAFPMSDLESRTRYEPAEVEPRIVERWLESGLFHPDPEGTADENYSIAIPPPNVTGVLHMGHALNNSIQDCLVRYARMQGRRTKWILGTDHAGIATQTQVERALLDEGTSREELGREAFVERVWQWRGRYGGDAGRHGGGGQSRRRALSEADRRDRDSAARRPPAEDHRRRVCEARVRDRRAQDHSGPRPQRLRDRQAPRLGADHGDRRGRAADR